MSKDTIHLFNNIAVRGLIANGFIGSAGQALLSNGSSAYWGAGSSTVTTSPTAPVSPVDGDLWWDETVGQLKIYYSDGTSSQWVDSSASATGFTGSQGTTGFTGSSGVVTRAIPGFFTGIPAADETITLYVAVEAITFAANFSGSRGKIGINPTSSFVLTVYKNPTFTGLVITGGTVIATITISTSGVFTFATTGGLSQTLANGDMLGVKAPSTPDTTAACASFNLLGAL